MEHAGRDHQAAPGGHPQFRWRQRLHRSAGSRTPTRPPKRSPKRFSNWGTETGAVEVAVLLDRPHRRPAAHGQGPWRVTEIVHEMAGGLSGGTDAAHAIMTTDTVPKQVALHHPQGWNVGGMGKGAGMMNSVAGDDAGGTDHRRRRHHRTTRRRIARCRRQDLRQARCRQVDLHQRHCAAAQFGGERHSADQTDLDAAVFAVCDDLAAQMQADGEGVTKRIVITVTGAVTEDDAVTVARAVARDSLVKTALFGADPNWGRVLAAVGISPVTVDPDIISVSFNGQAVCRNGYGVDGARDVDLSVRIST